MLWDVSPLVTGLAVWMETAAQTSDGKTFVNTDAGSVPATWIPWPENPLAGRRFPRVCSS